MSCDLLILVLNLFIYLFDSFVCMLSVSWLYDDADRSFVQLELLIGQISHQTDGKMEETIWLVDRVMHRSNQ